MPRTYAPADHERHEDCAESNREQGSNDERSPGGADLEDDAQNFESQEHEGPVHECFRRAVDDGSELES